MLPCVALRFVVLCCSVLCRAVPCRAVLWIFVLLCLVFAIGCAVMCLLCGACCAYVVLCYVLWCCTLLCHVVLYYVDDIVSFQLIFIFHLCGTGKARRINKSG